VCNISFVLHKPTQNNQQKSFGKSSYRRLEYSLPAYHKDNSLDKAEKKDFTRKKDLKEGAIAIF
jgi:hypothetical protein